MPSSTSTVSAAVGNPAVTYVTRAGYQQTPSAMFLNWGAIATGIAYSFLFLALCECSFESVHDCKYRDMCLKDQLQEDEKSCGYLKDFWNESVDMHRI